MAAMNVGVLGSGAVGQTLADGFLRHGYTVMRGSREPAKLEVWKAGAGASASIGRFADAAKFGQLVVLAVKGTGAEDAIAQCGDGALDGKTVIDTTNPIADAPPVNNVIQLFTGPNDSLMERLQKRWPRVNFVKAFSCVGNALMVNPDLGGIKPTMFLCGNDAGAKAEVEEILAAFGWEWEDMGGVEGARAIEPLVSLWCIPGFIRGTWGHAFKLLRK